MFCCAGRLSPRSSRSFPASGNFAPDRRAADPYHLSLRRRRLGRRRVAADRRPDAHRARPSGDRREARGRRWAHWRAGGEGGGARRHHAVADANRAGRGLSARLRQARLRSDRRTRADFSSRCVRFRHRGGSAGRGQDAARLGRLGESQSVAGELCRSRLRRPAALSRRHVSAHRRHRSARGALSRLGDQIGKAGHVPIEITTTSDLVQMHKAGRIRVLATSDKARSPFLPDVPTFGEAGYNLVATGWYGMFAPAPPDIVARLNAVLPRNSPPYRRRRRNNGHPPSRRRDLRPRSKARTHDGTDGGEHPA